MSAPVVLRLDLGELRAALTVIRRAEATLRRTRRLTPFRSARWVRLRACVSAQVSSALQLVGGDFSHKVTVAVRSEVVQSGQVDVCLYLTPLERAVRRLGRRGRVELKASLDSLAIRHVPGRRGRRASAAAQTFELLSPLSPSHRGSVNHGLVSLMEKEWRVPTSWEFRIPGWVFGKEMRRAAGVASDRDLARDSNLVRLLGCGTNSVRVQANDGVRWYSHVLNGAPTVLSPGHSETEISVDFRAALTAAALLEHEQEVTVCVNRGHVGFLASRDFELGGDPYSCPNVVAVRTLPSTELLPLELADASATLTLDRDEASTALRSLLVIGKRITISLGSSGSPALFQVGCINECGEESLGESRGEPLRVMVNGAALASVLAPLPIGPVVLAFHPKRRLMIITSEVSAGRLDGGCWAIAAAPTSNATLAEP